MGDTAVAGLLWLLAVVGVGYFAAVDLFIHDALAAEEFVRFEVCAYAEDHKSFTRPNQEYALVRHFWVNPSKISAIGFEQADQGLQCSRLFFGTGGQILVVGNVDEVRRKLGHQGKKP